MLEIKILNEYLVLRFEIKDLGPMRYFVGMEIVRSNKEIIVSKRKYIFDILKEIGMSNY